MFEKLIMQEKNNEFIFNKWKQFWLLRCIKKSIKRKQSQKIMSDENFETPTMSAPFVSAQLLFFCRKSFCCFIHYYFLILFSSFKHAFVVDQTLFYSFFFIRKLMLHNSNKFRVSFAISFALNFILFLLYK